KAGDKRVRVRECDQLKPHLVVRFTALFEPVVVRWFGVRVAYPSLIIVLGHDVCGLLSQLKKALQRLPKCSRNYPRCNSTQESREKRPPHAINLKMSHITTTSCADNPQRIRSCARPHLGPRHVGLRVDNGGGRRLHRRKRSRAPSRRA